MAKFHQIRGIFYYLLVFLIVSCSSDVNNSEASVSSDKAAADSVAEVMYDLIDSNRFKESIEVGAEAVRLYEAIDDSLGISDVVGSMSVAYMRLGNMTASLEYAQRALEIDEHLNDFDLLSSDYNTLASLYLSDGQIEMAKEFIGHAIEYEMKTDTKRHLTNRYGIASEIYAKAGEGLTALNYAKKGYDLAAEKNDSIQMGKRLSQLGDAYVSLHDFDQAIEVYTQCANLLEAQQSWLSLGIDYKQLGNAYRQKGQKTEAIRYYRLGAEWARKVSYTYLLQQCLQALAELNAPNDVSTAYQYLSESHALSDSIHSHEVADLTTSFAAQYEMSKKEQTIAEQASTIRRNKITIAIGYSLFFLALITIIVNIYIVRLRRKGEQLEGQLAKIVVQEAMHKQPEISENDRKFIRHLADFVEAHISDCNLSTAMLAEEFCLSPRQFSRRVKEITNVDTTHYIRAARIMKARTLLTETELPISEIYFECGFESANYFARVFKQDVGVSPSEFRTKG